MPNADLPGLGGRLKLPPGWRYETMTPASDLIVGAKGRAIIVQDDLDDAMLEIGKDAKGADEIDAAIIGRDRKTACCHKPIARRSLLLSVGDHLRNDVDPKVCDLITEAP
ncbi:MAG: hypothetical protein WB677_07160 [Xanthobacteraceae bacterium]